MRRQRGPVETPHGCAEMNLRVPSAPVDGKAVANSKPLQISAFFAVVALAAAGAAVFLNGAGADWQ